jgi:hypothetical protein
VVRDFDVAAFDDDLGLGVRRLFVLFIGVGR